MKLNKGLARKIVVERNNGKTASKLADAFGVTERRINQVYLAYLRTGTVPSIGDGVGRPVKPVQAWEVEVAKKAFESQRVGARRLEKVIRQDYQLEIGHNRLHGILLAEGLAKPNPNKQKRRKYIRYEREHSLSAAHLDWHNMKDGRHVIAVLDDSSRKILSGGEFDAESCENTLAVSNAAIESVAGFACIREFITDNGAVFTCNEEGCRDSSQFEQFLHNQHITHIRIKPHHPQSNGKIEKWFDAYERHRGAFESFEEFMAWYNNVRYHESLDCKQGLRTPSQAFLHKLAPEHVFGLTKGLFNW